MTQSMYLRTEELPLESLTPFPGNAKRGAVDRIRESLKEHGQYRALVVRHTPDGAFVVLAGNHTLLALKAEGVPQARCELIACDDISARKINIADNRLPELGGYDDSALATILAEMEGDFTGTGYTDEEADDLLALLDTAEELPYTGPGELGYNDSAEERHARKISNGGEDSRTMESRGIRDIILALRVNDADELGRLLVRLREQWGPLSQGEIILKACRVAASYAGNEDAAVAAEYPYTGDDD